MTDLHERIAEKLGWQVEETQTFSLQSLREFVRPASPKLAHEIDLVIRSGSYIVGEPLKRKRHK